MARRSIGQRVREDAEAQRAAQKYVGPIELMYGLGWLSYSPLNQWRQGRVPYLEQALQASPDMIAEALEELRRWSSAQGLHPAEVDHIARTRDRRRLQCVSSDDPDAERAFRTVWLSADLTESQRRRLVDRLSRPPDLVVVHARKDWTCSDCGHEFFGGALLIMEGAGPHCMECADIGHLEYLPAGDARLTRRAKRLSPLTAVVVRWSRTRRRYEREGILVDPDALREAEASI